MGFHLPRCEAERRASCSEKGLSRCTQGPLAWKRMERERPLSEPSLFGGRCNYFFTISTSSISKTSVLYAGMAGEGLCAP